jgi:hypothetical protein
VFVAFNAVYSVRVRIITNNTKNIFGEMAGTEDNLLRLSDIAFGVDDSSSIPGEKFGIVMSLPRQEWLRG